jgi:putative copper resistance protein D
MLKGQSVPTRPVPALPALWTGLAVTTTLAAGVLTAAPGAAGAGGGLAVSRSVMVVAGVAVVGLALLGVILPAGHKRAPAVLARVDRLTVIAAAGWLAATVLLIVFQAADAAARPVSAVGVAELTAWSTGVGAGQGMLLTAVAAAIVLAGAVVRLRRPALVPPRAVLSAAAFAMITPAVTGHAAAADRYQLVSVVGIGVHVAAAAAWVGGLGALLTLVAPHQGLLVAVLPRYSQVATACIVGVAATGALTTAIHVAAGHWAGHGGWEAGWETLPGTGWGQIVLAKTAALAAIGALGWLTRRRMAASRTPLLRWAGYEVALMALALGAAAALTQAPS